MSDAIETQGTKLYINTGVLDASPPTWTEVKEMVSFNAFDGEAAEIGTTHLGSTAKEFLMGLQDWGNLQGEFNFVSGDTGQQAMLTAKSDRARRNFRVTLSNNHEFLFDGFVKNAPMTGGVDAKVDRSFAIRITGDVTDTPPA